MHHQQGGGGGKPTKVKLIWLNEHECVAILYGREIQKVSGNFLFAVARLSVLHYSR